MDVKISRLSFYDGEGLFTYAPFKVFVIAPGSWKRKLVAVFNGEKYNKWVNVDLAKPVPAKYLVIEKWRLFPNEIKIYGDYKPVSAKVPQPVKRYKFENYLGINGFEWDVLRSPQNLPYEQIDEQKFKLIMPFKGGFRHYMDWKHIEFSPGKYTFNPVRDGFWSYDLMYKRLKEEGIEPLICFKTIPDFILQTYPEKLRGDENIPMRYGADPADPRSYIEQARAAFQLAARYGSNKTVDPSLVNVDEEPFWSKDGPRNVAKTGLGYIKYIECDNERDKWWDGRRAYQTGREYAANLSAFYDGHQGKLGRNVGVKAADPGCQVVIGGLSTPEPDYIRAIIDWCKEFRNGSLCFDVINYHQYANSDGSIQYGGNGQGIAPEASQMSQTAAKFLKLSAGFAGSKEVWVTETGYDFTAGSPQRAVQIGQKCPLQTQADWIIRTALLFSREGIARSFYYQLFDDNESGGLFSSSGLADKKVLERKPALDYILQAGNLLGDYKYVKTISSNPIVDKYSFKGSDIYVLVSPTQNGSIIPFSLYFGSKTESVKVHQLKEGQEKMNVSLVSVRNQRIKLRVGETPVFVELPH